VLFHRLKYRVHVRKKVVVVDYVSGVDREQLLSKLSRVSNALEATSCVEQGVDPDSG
jgi:hypothetical protein